MCRGPMTSFQESTPLLLTHTRLALAYAFRSMPIKQEPSTEKALRLQLALTIVQLRVSAHPLH